MSAIKLETGDKVSVGGRLGVVKGFAKDDPTVPWIYFPDGDISWDARDLKHGVKFLAPADRDERDDPPGLRGPLPFTSCD